MRGDSWSFAAHAQNSELGGHKWQINVAGGGVGWESYLCFNSRTVGFGRQLHRPGRNPNFSISISKESRSLGISQFKYPRRHSSLAVVGGGPCRTAGVFLVIG